MRKFLQVVLRQRFAFNSFNCLFAFKFSLSGGGYIFHFIQMANGVFHRLTNLRPRWRDGDILHVPIFQKENEKESEGERMSDSSGEQRPKSTAEMESVYRLISLLNFIGHFIKENLQVCKEKGNVCECVCFLGCYFVACPLKHLFYFA